MTREEFKEAVEGLMRLNKLGHLSDYGLIDAVVILAEKVKWPDA